MKTSGGYSPHSLRRVRGTENSMEPSYLHNGESILKCVMGGIRKELRDPNLGYALAYEKELRSAGKEARTIAKRLGEVRFILNSLGAKDAKTLREEDVKDLVRMVMASEKAPISKRKVLLTMRVFISWLNGCPVDSREYSESVKSVKVTLRNLGKNVRNSQKGPDEILTLDEIKSMVEVADTQLERAMVMLLASTGCRVGELLNVRMASLQLVNGPGERSHITYTGKTGTRTAPLFADVIPFLKEYISDERKKEDDKDPHLFIYKGKALDFKNVRYILKKLSARANITPADAIRNASWWRTSLARKLHFSSTLLYPWTSSTDIVSFCDSTFPPTQLRITNSNIGDLKTTGTRFPHSLWYWGFPPI